MNFARLRQFLYIATTVETALQSVGVYYIIRFIHIDPATTFLRYRLEPVFGSHVFFSKVTVIIFKIDAVH
jgi:hypothetical protein